MPALSGSSTRRPRFHRLQQPVHKIRWGWVGALHQASFHTLHYCIALPESFGMMAMMQWIKVPAVLLLENIEMHLVVVEVVVGVEHLRDGLVDAGKDLFLVGGHTLHPLL